MNEGNIPGKNEALISLILGIVGLVVALFVNGIFGMILGIAGLVVSSRSKSMGYNDSLRTAGFVLSVLSVVLGGIPWWPALPVRLVWVFWAPLCTKKGKRNAAAGVAAAFFGGKMRSCSHICLSLGG